MSWTYLCFTLSYLMFTFMLATAQLSLQQLHLLSENAEPYTVGHTQMQAAQRPSVFHHLLAITVYALCSLVYLW